MMLTEGGTDQEESNIEQTVSGWLVKQMRLQPKMKKRLKKLSKKARIWTECKRKPLKVKFYNFSILVLLFKLF